MGKVCYVCKKRYSPYEDRSYHCLPKNDDLKKKWIEVLEIDKAESRKTLFICSDHFSKNCFADTVLNKNKTLTKDAIPYHISNNESINLLVTNDHIESASIIVDTQDDQIEISECEYITIESETENLIFGDPTDIVEELMTIETEHSYNKLDRILNEDENDTNIICNVENVDSPKSRSSVATEKKLPKAKERQTQKSISKTRYYQFIWNNKMKKICRDLFVSDEAYETFLQFASVQEKIIKSMQKIISQKKKQSEASIAI